MIKKLLTVGFSVLMFLTVLAQEAEETAAQSDAEVLDDDVLKWLILVWVVVTTILVLRTFRGKAEI